MITPARHRELVGAAELTRMLGLSKARVYQLVAEPDFPEPAVSLVMGHVWELTAVQAWAEQKGRTLSPLPADWPPPGMLRGGARRSAGAA